MSVLVLILTIGSGNAWGVDPSWTYTFTAAPSISNNQFAVNSATWTVSTTTGAGSPGIANGNDNSVSCVKFGGGASNYFSNITLSTSYFADYCVKSVYIVGCSNNGNKTVTISATQGTGGSAVTIGSTSITKGYDTNWHTLSACQKTMNTNQGGGGVLTISISPDACAFSIKTITVTYVSNIAVTGVTVDPTSKAIVPGQTFTITPTVSPSNATNKNIDWSTSNGSYATVSSGTVTGVAAGSATITATSAADNTKSASCSVTVYGVTISMVGEDESTVLTGAGIPSAPTRTGASISVDNSTLYGFKKWVISNASLGSAATTQGNTITNPTGSVTLKAVYYAPRTVTWIVNGAEYTPYTTTGEGTDGTTAVQRGKQWSTLTLPTDPDPEDYCGKKFMGWTTTNIGAAGLDKDDDADDITALDLMTSANKSSKTGAGRYINNNIIFYAVFADYDE